jgi:uncharacterized RDD family membrane protein YckC
MVWYYRDSDQEIGPVSKAELQNLVKSKQVSAQTLVRNVEMADWVPLIDVVRGKAGQPQSPPSPPLNTTSMDSQGGQTGSGDDIGELTMDSKDDTEPGEGGDKDSAGATNGAAAELAMCSQCGGTFPEDQVIAIEDRMICAACKPMFVQKLKEGVAMPLSTAFGGFWIRTLAYLIDSFVYGIVSWIIILPISMFVMPAMMQAGDQAAIGSMFALFGLSMFIGLAAPTFYFTFFHGRWGATVGKMACGLRVVTAEGEPITYMRAFGRFWAFMLSGLILYIGYFMAGFDDEKRSLHDRICSTRVIKKR